MMFANRRVDSTLYRIILCPTIAMFYAASVLGQQPVFQAPTGEAAIKRLEGRGPRGPRTPPPQEDKKPEEGKKAEEGDGKKEEGDKEKGEEQKEQETSLKRPKSPPRVPDPREFDVLPDENDRLRFSFTGQMWPDVLQWVASLGDHSLDWQELPDDYINFTANRDYTLPEVRDLFNRLLFERGYTMILEGEVLLVLKIDKLDPSLLPRVEDESQLMDLRPHDFVKITFQLPSQLKADKAAEDVKPLLSSHAKVQPLMTTNRLLVVDIVANLREVSRLVNTEHAAATGNIIPREFPIRFARASHIADQVMILLGLDPASRRTPQELQVEQQKIQLFAQMQQKGKDVTKYLRPGSAPRVFLAVNERNNTVLANAPIDEMKVIERSIELLDTPSGMLAGATPTSLTMEKYQLVTLKPESVVTALEDIAEIDPRTRLKIDSDAKTVFAYATARDHEKISAMIDQLDGSGRELEVVWLRRLPADAVATTIQNLMVGQEEEEDERSYWGWRSRDREEDPPNKGFRVDADIENNRLLLWANATEMKEVRKFLAKLGEIPGDTGNPNTVRVLDARDPNATLKLLEQLRLMWPAIGPNELRIEGTLPKPEPETQRPEDATGDDDDQDDPPKNLFLDTSVMRTPSPNVSRNEAELQVAWLADDRAPVPDAEKDRKPTAVAEDKTNPPAAPPVVITVDETGRIIISSRDTKALDQLEELVTRIAPQRKDYEVFYLQNALASLVTLNLEEYFEEDADAEDGFWRGWYGFDFEQNKSKGEGLSKRPKIRFIYDYDTNSILVANASPDQLSTVRGLIEIYDKPPSDDSISARRYQIYQLKHARAETVAETIKDVYRDLLSSKDKVFERNRGEKEQSSQTTNVYRVYGSGDDDKKPKKIRASFSGALSVGVDKTSNTVIISAQEEWIPSISEMIKYLDVEAEPHKPTIEVVKTKIDAKILQSALAGTFGQQGKTPDEKKPPTEEQPPKNPEQMEQRQRQLQAVGQ